MRATLFIGIVEITVVAAMCQVIAGQSVAMRISNIYGEGEYEFTITQEELDKSPPWLEDQDAPALAPRAAIRIAKKYVSRAMPHPEEWLVRKVELERVGGRGNQWIYVIDFVPYEPKKYESALTVFRIPVLLNGITVEPITRPAGRR